MSSRPQAISGVSASAEADVMVVYPSLAATGAGRMIGRLMTSIPVGIRSVKLSYLIFGPLFAPLAATLYFLQKAGGVRYVLTNRRLAAWKMTLGVQQRLVGEVDLTQVAEVSVSEQDGQAFYRAADLSVLDSAGNPLLKIEGVARPEVFRQNILKAAQSRRHVQQSLATIDARHG